MGALLLKGSDPFNEKARIRTALFGDGSQDDTLISRILIGAPAANDYPNMHEVLRRLGIPTGNDLQHHFHIYLNPPDAVAIDNPQNLLSDALTGSPTGAASPGAMLQAETQGLLDYAQTLTDTGEELMLIIDVPYVPPQDTPIVLAQAATSGAGSTPQFDYILKDCQETESAGDPMSAMRSVDPAGSLAVYLGNRDNRSIYSDRAAMATIKITLLEDTRHGELTAGTTNYGRTAYGYDPEPNYVGKDRAVFMAEFEGKRYKIVIDLRVFVMVDENNPVCPPPKLIKVKKTTTGSTGYDLNTLAVTFAALDGGAIGLTNASGITLDDNAAGYNWFIDTTPADNSEYLPTSNPNEWVAKEGTAAYGKMDMLSVLLHEYGHALGIEHSADNHDYMATTLTPGVRRMPSADELALMQRLVGQVKEGMVAATDVSTPTLTLPLQGGGNGGSGGGGLPLPVPLGAGFGVAFLGRLRGSRYGDVSIVPDYATLITRYEAAANASFTTLDSPTGWNTVGGVEIDPSTGSGRPASATLREVSTSQTRLGQVFAVNEEDRYLTFTLSGTALDNLTGAPDDAFEVALLDANHGGSLLGTDGLMKQLAIRLGGQTTPAKSLVMTRTDAIINLQGDGTQHLADCVTCTYNSDGSRTYRIDLSGIAAGTVANLSFDLLGFGADNSHVTVGNVRVSGLPELHDDAATLDEDGTLAYDPFAQVDNAAALQLGSHLVDQPAHGMCVL